MNLQESLEAFIRYVMRDTKYLGQYPATVQAQSGPNLLDLLPDDEIFKGQGIQRVQIRHGLPGVEVTVAQGARVMLGFEGGKPSAPYAALWEPGSIESIKFDGGTQPVARAGDPVTAWFPPSMAVLGTFAGNAFSGTITITSPGSGVIGDGAERVFA